MVFHPLTGEMQRRKIGTLQHRSVYCDSFAEVIRSKKIKAPLTSEGAIFLKAKVYGLSTGWLTFHHTFGRKTGPDLSNWEWTGMTKQKQQLVEIWSYLQTSPNHSKPIYWLIESFHQLDWSLPQPPSMTPLFTIFAGMGPKMVGEYPTISLISPCCSPHLMDGDGKPSTRPLWTAIAPAQCPNDLITTGRSWFLTWSWV